MPKQIFDVKEFLALASGKNNGIKIKKNKDCVKFKCRSSRNLVTLVMKDAKKAAKLEASLKRTPFKPEIIKN